MKLLKGLFGNNLKSGGTPVESLINWIPLKTESQLEDIKKASKEKTSIIFKHSTRCGISRMVLKSFEKQWAETPNVNFYFLDLIKYRALSNAVAQTLGVVHQSPQIIVLKSGKVLTSGSHYDILEIKV